MATFLVKTKQQFMIPFAGRDVATLNSCKYQFSSREIKTYFVKLVLPSNWMLVFNLILVQVPFEMTISQFSPHTGFNYARGKQCLS